MNNYRFVAELVNYAAYTTKNHTQWSLLFGYFHLIHPILVTMCEEAPDYSKNTISVCILLFLLNI